MIFLNKTVDKNTPLAHFKLKHSLDVFIKARDIYYQDKYMELVTIPVVGKNNKVAYYLSWKANDQKAFPHIAPYLFIDSLWTYSLNCKEMDTLILRQNDYFVFDKIEEYSCAIARILMKQFPKKQIVFLDDMAKLFFKPSKTIHFYKNKQAFLKAAPKAKDNKKVLYVPASVFDAQHIPSRVSIWTNTLSSLIVMQGLFWKTNKVSYGDKNPDKTFYLIKGFVGTQGFSDLVRFPIYKADLAYTQSNFIPVIDMSVPGDKNQYNHGNGENAWEYFFKPLNKYTLEEVYQSKNVVLGQDQIIWHNPYLLFRSDAGDHALYMKKYLRFKPEIEANNKRLFKQTIPCDPHDVLAVVGRGTDYNNPQNHGGGVLKKPIDGPTLVKKVRQILKETKYKYIFLATEDSAVLKAFLTSDLKNKTLYVDQKRYDTSKDVYRSLYAIYNETNLDGIKMNMTYIAVIYILSKCDAIVCSTRCGSFETSIAWNDNKFKFKRILNEEK